MSKDKVDWDNAPEKAQFYSLGRFRYFSIFGREYFYDDLLRYWRASTAPLTRVEHEMSEDFELRPCVPSSVVSTTDVEYKVPEKSCNFNINAIKSEWTATHYDNFYQLTEADIKKGYVKVDAYFVNKLWCLNSKDDTGCLFHSLKTIARFGDKNPIERELKALYAQTKRMAELYEVDLE